MLLDFACARLCLWNSGCDVISWCDFSSSSGVIELCIFELFFRFCKLFLNFHLKTCRCTAGVLPRFESANFMEYVLYHWVDSYPLPIVCYMLICGLPCISTLNFCFRSSIMQVTVAHINFCSPEQVVVLCIWLGLHQSNATLVCWHGTGPWSVASWSWSQKHLLDDAWVELLLLPKVARTVRRP